MPLEVIARMRHLDAHEKKYPDAITQELIKTSSIRYHLQQREDYEHAFRQALDHGIS